jgi:tetratricopeptide (TPR) repeat protein
MALFPAGQSIDHDYPPSHTLLEHGAIFYILVLAVLVTLALRYRRQYPLSCFGLLMFLIFLAPTSSIIPLDDALVERRMYLALVGLLLIACEWASRWRVSRTTAACLLVIMGLGYAKLCRDRNQLWGEPDRLLEMAAASAFYNPRPLLNFTEVLIAEGRCDLAPGYLQRAEQRLPNNYYVNAAWGRTLACLGRLDLGMQRLQAAARIHPCSEIYEWMGLLYGQMGLLEPAGEVLRKAVDLDPGSETAHGSLALWFENTRNLPAAEREYRTAMTLDRSDYWAKAGFNRVRAMEAGGVSRQ